MGSDEVQNNIMQGVHVDKVFFGLCRIAALASTGQRIFFRA